MNQNIEVARYDDCIRTAYAAAAGSVLFDRLREALQRYLQADTAQVWSSHAISLAAGQGMFPREGPIGPMSPALVAKLLAMPAYGIAIDADIDRSGPAGQSGRCLGLRKSGGAGHRAACWFDIAEGWLGVLIMMNEPDRCQLGEAQIERMMRIAPHVRDALAFGLDLQRSRAIRRSVGALLSRCQGALFVCDRDGWIIGATPAAEAVFDQFREHVQSLDGRLTFACCDVNQRLQRMLRDPRNTDSRAIPVCTPPGDGAASLSCIVMPLELPLITSSGNHALRAVVLFQPDQVGSIDRQYLQSRFEITRTEADILALLMEGLLIEAVAARRHSTVNTIRSYMKSLRQKMDCHTQAQLVAKGWRNMLFASRPPSAELAAALSADALSIADREGSSAGHECRRPVPYL